MNKKFLAFYAIGMFSLSQQTFAQGQAITTINAFYQTAQTGNVSYSVNGQISYFGTTGGSDKNDMLLQGYTAGSKNYVLSSLIPANVKFRRVDNVNATGNKAILFFEINDSMYTAPAYAGWLSSTDKYMKSSYIDSMELAFTGRTINRGGDNTLGNLGNNQGNNNNVERIDVVFDAPRPILANNGNGITIFERGTPTNHGAIKIALILSVDAQGNPTSYSNIYTLNNSDWGATDVISNRSFGIMNSTSNPGAVPPPYKISVVDAVEQSIGGMFVPFVGSFGLSATATPTVYGYSIMAGDVTATNSSEILDYTNSSIYPTNTDGNANTIGGMDLIGVTMDFEDATIDPVTIGGNVFDDGNGLTDAIINGTAINSVSGQQLYVTLFDRSTGLVIASVPVAANGSWTMPNIPKNSVYNLSIGTVLGTVGSPNPGANIPSDWNHTAEWQGTSVSGTYPGNVQGDGFYMVTLGSSDITDLSFGLDKKPVPASQSYTLDAPPAMNSSLTLNGTGATNSPAALNGTDAEDGVKGAGSTFVITSIPAQNGLWYNGIQITGTDTIPNFNPALLSVKFTNGGTSPVSFNYTVLDNAGVAGSSVQYFITFPGALPAILTGFTAQLKGKDVQVHWTSTLEINVGRYVIEHSVNGADFEVIGSQATKGNSVEVNTYNFVHNNVSNGTHYYRLRIQDNDGSSALSAVKMVRLNSADQITVSPNPVPDKAYIKGLNTNDIVSVYDVNGRVVYTSVATGSSIIVDFSLLNQGVYFINITDAQSTAKYTGKTIKK